MSRLITLFAFPVTPPQPKADKKRERLVKQHRQSVIEAIAGYTEATRGRRMRQVAKRGRVIGGYDLFDSARASYPSGALEE